jgi:hypothetical protein
LLFFHFKDFNMKLKQLAAAMAGAGLLASAGASHAFLTTVVLNPGTVVNFDNYDGFVTSGPETVAPGVSFSGSSSTLGAFIADLGGNGVWGVGKVFAGLGSFFEPVAPGQMTFSFATGQATVGAFINTFAPDGQVTISAFGAANNLLDQHTVMINTPNGENAGAFFGIGLSSPEIRSIRFSGSGVVIDDLAISTTVVPLPAAAWLFGAGLAAMGVFGRRRVKAS